jgi:hypothetical protein
VRPSGVVKHVIAKPLPFAEPPSAENDPYAVRFHRLGVDRLASLLEWFDEADLATRSPCGTTSRPSAGSTP